MNLITQLHEKRSKGTKPRLHRVCFPLCLVVNTSETVGCELDQDRQCAQAQTAWWLECGHAGGSSSVLSAPPLSQGPVCTANSATAEVTADT